MKTDAITLQTMDGVSIAGDWTVPEGAAQAALLLHMMPATKESFAPLTKVLNKAGVATLAIDLRGHGKSAQTLDYKTFTDLEHQSSRLDVDASVNWLKEHGFLEENIAFVGASIGANLSLDALERYKGAKRAVLLSPGLDYRGLKTSPMLRSLASHQKVWIVAAKGDEYSRESTQTLASIQPELAKAQIYEGSEHGTSLFAKQPALIPEIVTFLTDEPAPAQSFG